MQVLDIKNFPGGATSITLFLKGTKQRKTKVFSPMSGSTARKVEQRRTTSKQFFLNKLHNINPLEKDYNGFEELTTGGLLTEQALFKLRLKKIHPTGDENYAHLRSIWMSEVMKFFNDFFMWYNNKDVVPTLKAMQKMTEFCPQKEIDILKLGCILSNLATICLHNSTDSKFYPFTESDKNLLKKIREITVGGPPIVFTRKAVVDETFIRKSTNLAK